MEGRLLRHKQILVFSFAHVTHWTSVIAITARHKPLLCCHSNPWFPRVGQHPVSDYPPQISERYLCPKNFSTCIESLVNDYNFSQSRVPSTLVSAILLIRFSDNIIHHEAPTTASLPPAGGPWRADSRSSSSQHAGSRKQNKTKQLYARIKGGEESCGLGEVDMSERRAEASVCVLLVLGRRPQQDSTVSSDKSEVCSSCKGGLLTGRSFSFPLRMLALNFVFQQTDWALSWQQKGVFALLLLFIYLFVYLYAGSYWGDNKVYSVWFYLFHCPTLRVSLLSSWRVLTAGHLT